MTNLFKPASQPIPTVTPTPRMPDPQSPDVLEAQRLEQQRMMARAGRRSTILTGNNDNSSGGTAEYRSTRLGTAN